MKTPWPLYLAWKHLFPSRKKFSFFSLLAVIGVALGVNVMIVVVAFMKGFQQKFREDIIDAQGHARAIPLSRNSQWRSLQSELLARSEVKAVSPYLQGPLLLRNQESHSVPLAIGLDLRSSPSALPLNQFLGKGQMKMKSNEWVDLTPVAQIEDLNDEVVFVSQYVANTLGVRPAAILIKSEHALWSKLGLRVCELSGEVPSAEWRLSCQGEDLWRLSSGGLNFEATIRPIEGKLNAGPGAPVFELPLQDDTKSLAGSEFVFQTFRASSIEIFSPAMFDRAQANEISPPKEVLVGGVFEVPWQGFHAEAVIGSFELLEDLRSVSGVCDGMFLKLDPAISSDEVSLHRYCANLELQRSMDWAFIPWFVENAWFFELLKFEEYLMILIMVPIGLVAAFAIAIALMTTVLRKIREIGLLVAMGGARLKVGLIFCMQGFLIGSIGALLGCVLALIFIRWRDSIMSFIVLRIAGDEGRAGVAQFYDFYSLRVPYPWESAQSASTFLTFSLFAVLVSTLAGLIPAWRAARMNPAEALRNE